MADGEVITAKRGAVGRLRLDRPAALNALTLPMCQAMIAALLAWRDDATIQAVVIDHATERGFCAGGDIRAVAESARHGGEAGRIFFLAEYRLDHLIGVLHKPVVAVMDGVTMGGGAGVALPARYRLATERTLFAMPETTIGFFPDVGASWWLPRLPGKAGLWLALTGARLDARACLELGLATHFVPSDRLAALKAAVEQRPDAIDALLAEVTVEPPGAGLEHRAEIDALFDADSLAGVMANLHADGGAFAAQTLATLAAKSPLSLAVAFRLMQVRPQSLAEALALDYRLAAREVLQPDFVEGVRALLVDKDNRPAWRPPPADALLDSLFAPLPAGQEWTPLQALDGSRA
jgi:enoyl-CoA hydratase